MRTLYLDCSMGAAGDMLTAALTELMPDPDAFIARLNALGIPDVEIRREPAEKCGIAGTRIRVTVSGHEEGEAESGGHTLSGAGRLRVSVRGHVHVHDHAHAHGHEHTHENDLHEHDHEHEYDHDHDHDHIHDHAHHHHHSGMTDIERIIGGLDIPENVRRDILGVYSLIAEAESRAHGVPVTEIHFHEVGTMDAVADITAVCLAVHELAPEEIVVSPVCVGSGHVRCAHGVLPVPAPATAYILRDVPTYSGEIRSELCTPTGAALIKHFAARFGDMPLMRTRAIGYGMGKKDFEAANCVRAMLGDAEERTDEMIELSCNVDDMTAEELGFAMERLFEGGAVEVYTVPLGMKKCRPGTLLRVMCREDEREAVLGLIFLHTTTIGVREQRLRRYVLRRESETVTTPLGELRRKISTGYGVRREKYEFEDLARIARERGVSLREVEELLRGKE